MGKFKNTSYDVIICGGGFTGTLLAIALARQGLSVTLLDRRSFKTPIQNDGRTFAITLGSQRYLERLGIWDRLQSPTTPIQHILITDHKSRHQLQYDAADLGPDPMGYMVRAEDLDQALKSQLQGIEIIEEAELSSIEYSLSKIQLTAQSGLSVSAPLAVAADGKFSKLRDLAAISHRIIPYAQKAIVGVVAHENSHHFIAFEHFTPFGPLAFLPLEGNTSAFVWSLETDKADTMMALSDDEFALELEATFGPSLGKLTLLTPRQTYPLSLTTSQKLYQDRIVLLGDAAHSMHPVAGQGLNLGIRDVESLAQILSEAKNLGLDLGSPTLLEKYAQSRKWDQTSLLSSTHGLIRLFGNSARSLRFLRGTGLSLVGMLPPLKRILMKRAMGLRKS